MGTATRSTYFDLEFYDYVPGCLFKGRLGIATPSQEGYNSLLFLGDSRWRWLGVWRKYVTRVPNSSPLYRGKSTGATAPCYKKRAPCELICAVKLSVSRCGVYGDLANYRLWVNKCFVFRHRKGDCASANRIHFSSFALKLRLFLSPYNVGAKVVITTRY